MRLADRPVVEASTVVAATPDLVWPWVSDVSRMPGFSGELQRTEWLDGVRGPAVGHRFLGYNAHPKAGEWQSTSTVIECDPPAVFAWAVSWTVDDADRPFAVWRITLRAAGAGTEVTERVQVNDGPSLIGNLIARMPDKEEKIVAHRVRELQDAVTHTLAGLKQAIEAAAPGR